nr:RibD C-terminal domain protein [uncultured bacterium]
MKITLIILQSLDGIIARQQGDDLSWGTAEDKNFFRSKTREIGTMIMGSSTYKQMPPPAFSDRCSLVFTSKPEEFPKQEQIHFFQGTPAEGVKYLESLGKTTAALIGGGTINNEFLEAGLVDELYITIAPRIFGTGVKGLGEKQLAVKLELLDFEKISKDELLLHYRVRKD